AAYARNSTYDVLQQLAWFGSQGRVVLARAEVPVTDPLKIRTASLIYLLIKGPNFFYAPQIEGTIESVPPAAYSGIAAALGSPAGALQVQREPGLTKGYSLYSRAYEKGIVYVNWTGKAKTVGLPAGQSYFDPDGNPVTQITVPDMTGTYVTK
ncbi:MAG: hypothetical protein M1436_03985, partial [Acidobacteria bacterium]|nr:hypothetical protein [Acidobacteriota bacterium]